MMPTNLPLHDLAASSPPPAGLLPLVDALGPRQALTLRLPAGAALSFLETLTAERKGLFEWSPDAEGAVVNVEVMRREAVRGADRGVLEALAWDHDRLDALERAAFEFRAAGDLATATTLFEKFARGLVRHIGFEEDLLFPILEKKIGFPPTAGPTAVMRAEHVEIRAALEGIRAAMPDPLADPLPFRRQLHDALGPHNEKEEQILYPMADRCLMPEGADDLVSRIQRYPAP